MGKMDRWGVGSWSLHYTLDCSGIEDPVATIPDDMVEVGREIARKLNAFDDILVALSYCAEPNATITTIRKIVREAKGSK